MSDKYVTVRNLDTGGVSRMLKAHAEHPVFGARLEIVPVGTKKKILIPRRFTEPAVELSPVEVEDSVVEEAEPEEKKESKFFEKKVKNG